jgi:predicted lipoprotein with Yx(FWY)xxD motif
MIGLSKLNIPAGGLAAAVGAAVIIAGCGSSGSTASHTSSAAAAGVPAASTKAKAPSGSGVRVELAHGSAGTYLAGPSGRALYLWEADSHNMSVCSGACAAAWPPLVSNGKPVAASGVQSGDLGTTTRSGGGKQVTYQGHPLYYFEGDPGSGSTTGQGSDGFGAKWWLVSPAGAAITSGASSGGSSSGGAPSSGGSSSAGGSGY